MVTLETLACVRGVAVNEMADELGGAGIKPTEFKEQPPGRHVAAIVAWTW